MHLKEIRKIYRNELGDLYPKEEIDSFFYLALEHYLNLERFILALQPEIILTKEEEAPLFECLSRLHKQEPIQYVLGETFFQGLRIKVDRSVLIPRPETEELVRWILEDYEQDQEIIKVLDIGTGSGCIAITLAKELHNAEVYGIDISPDALALARQNAGYHEVAIKFLEADITKINSLDAKYDVIVSNPPYVRIKEKENMKANVKDYEPHLALFVKNSDPLLFYRHILKFARDHLTANGSVYLEFNQFLTADLQKLLEEENFSEIELRKDMYGNDRMFRATKSG